MLKPTPTVAQAQIGWKQASSHRQGKSKLARLSTLELDVDIKHRTTTGQTSRIGLYLIGLIYEARTALQNLSLQRTVQRIRSPFPTASGAQPVIFESSLNLSRAAKLCMLMCAKSSNVGYYRVTHKAIRFQVSQVGTSPSPSSRATVRCTDKSKLGPLGLRCE
ncbi:hypothetical protein ABEF95_009590 [Exophiala dermatitidis]|uniref:Uncharacterized protein n=1 Tax=Exophiala dermatitidis (strain ATCC 34100 / CBS 525.76 / NIH/UT8656) TaxID=858893 RepID=H6CA53_EXODN|nr:uncharacterized protein HMPREF1120_07991 [Exophiala dermatitidis NIH/UT8656]EHY60016.1 hypothetical protein HMPREF1120_07991 [Exophiala dermatitidis NIH/UT8656]